MDSECWDRTIEICAAAQELKPEARDAFVREACGDDQELFEEVQQLLQQNAEKKSFLDQSPTEIVAQEIAGELPQYQVGQVINDYTLQKRLGSGGMGEVWLAEDSKPRRNVALKLLPLAFSQNAGWVHRFNQEAYAASRCQHENIIEIFKIGQEGEQHFIAMEYFVGKTLRERLQDSKLEPSIAIHLAVQIAAALEFAHEKGVIHRDIKPENIIVSAQDKAKVLDFGIAKLSALPGAEFGERNEEAEHSLQQISENNPQSEFRTPHSTALGKTMGTAGYMSPEQAKGETLDHRTDIFSLGLVLLEMVTGKGLFAGKAKKEVLELLQSEQEPLPADYNFKGTPKPLVQIIRKAVKRDPAARYDTSQAMLTDLQALQHRAATRQFKVKENWLKLAIAGALVLCAFAVWFSVQEVWEEKIMREGHTAAVRRAVFSPDGKLVMSVSEDKHAIVWDFASRKQLKVLTDHQGWVVSVNFSPDGKLFATGSVDQTVIVWETATLEKRTVLHCPDPVSFTSFSPNGKLLAASSIPNDHSLESKTILWNTNDWQVVQEIPQGIDYPNHLFSADSRSLMIGGEQFDLSTKKKPLNQKRLSTWNWAELSPDEKLLVITGGGGDVDFWALRTPGYLAGGLLLSSIHAHQDFGRSVAFSPDGKLVATASENVVLWDAATRQLLGRFEYDSIVWGITFSPDGRWLISTHGDGAILVWDVAARRRASGFNGHGDAVRAVAISPDGKYIASGGEDRSVIIWNTESGKKEMTLMGHDTRITGIVFSPDGKWVASCDQSASLIRWDLATRQPRWKVNRGFGSVGISVSPDGRWLGSSFGVFDAENGEMTIKFVDSSEQTAFTPDSQRMIAVGPILQVCDTATLQILKHEKVADDIPVGISIAPDGKNFAVGDAQGNISLWDTKSLRPIETIGKHDARIKQLTYTPDGKEIISAGDDRKINVWDVKGRKLVRTIGTYTSPVYSISLSRDGRKLVAGGHDKSVKLYTLHRELWGKCFD
jgi:WD40 repeat protein